ncbi:hypothetical protein OAJ57_01915, partial [Alphaproteobacteria bacterium]|nr:hypothetical protein [Alphaproteobacteria bacterium]
ATELMNNPCCTHVAPRTYPSTDHGSGSLLNCSLFVTNAPVTRTATERAAIVGGIVTLIGCRFERGRYSFL